LIQKILTKKQDMGMLRNRNAPYAIVLEATREMVFQVWKDGRSFASSVDGDRVVVSWAAGDTNVAENRCAIEKGCDILVATMGRLIQLYRDKIITLQNVEYLVLDEADRHLGFRDSLQEVAQLVSRLPEGHRTFMFSATYRLDIQELARQDFLRPNYYFARVGEMNKSVTSVAHNIEEVRHNEKDGRLLEMLEQWTQAKNTVNGRQVFRVKPTVVFVSQKRRSDRLAVFLAQKGYLAISLNADRSQEQRMEALEKLRIGEYDIIVATDALARGVNMKIEHVVVCDLSGEDEQWIHRIGRTGRAGNVGEAHTFVDPMEPRDRETASYLKKQLEANGRVVPDFLKKLVLEVDESAYRGGTTWNEGNGWGD
jgi:superfamily II DNA/RNA helicase